MRKVSKVGCVVVLMTCAGCSPYVMRYTHLSFVPMDGLEILEKSTTSLDTQGAELRSPKVGMPLKLRLARPHYTILFDTPLQSSPVVFLSARDKQGVVLRLSGAHVRRVYPGSGAELDGFEYSFYVQEAKGEPLAITIENATGDVVGSEVLPYEIVSRGYSYGIETL